MRPDLRQFGDLRPTDFDAVPVWAACHSLDYDEPWYDETDEETLRPWLGHLPVDPADGMFLVRARFSLADGREFVGFCTPGHNDDHGSLGTLQPYFPVADGFVGFWGGMIGVSDADRSAFLAAIGGNRGSAFPVEFGCDHRLASGCTTGTILGFYRLADGGEVVVE